MNIFASGYVKNIYRSFSFTHNHTHTQQQQQHTHSLSLSLSLSLTYTHTHSTVYLSSLASADRPNRAMVAENFPLGIFFISPSCHFCGAFVPQPMTEETFKHRANLLDILYSDHVLWLNG